MAVVRRGEETAADVRSPQGSFSGAAGQRTVHVHEQAAAVRVSFVRFEPGVRTAWHSHSGGQVLHVTGGEGRVQNRGEEAVTLGPGDTATAAAGQQHWHGAGPEGSFTHLAVTIGEVTWLEPSWPESLEPAEPA